MSKFLRWTGAALLAALACVGCGKPTGTISGTVTYGGTSLNAGTVTFYDAANLPVGSAAISPQGRYSVARVPVGLVKIVVTTPRSALPSTVPSLPKGKDAGEPVPPVTVPSSFSDPEKSGLTYTVTQGQQEHPIELK